MGVVGARLLKVGRVAALLGRLETLTYPEGGLAVRYEYQDGRVDRVYADAISDSVPVWERLSEDAYGHTTAERFGNGAETIRTFEHNEVRSIVTTSVAGGGLLQGLAYEYDLVGNLSLRVDTRRGQLERFFYDDLQRLVTTELQSGGHEVGEQLGYDRAGNIAFKSGVGNYEYGAGQPHAATAVYGHAYSYDAKGNQVVRDGINVAYNTFDLPVSLRRGAEELATFRYDGNGARVRKTSPYDDVLYFGGLYERHETSDGIAERFPIIIDGGMVAELAVTRSETAIESTLHYHHPDNLGSVSVVTDAAGAILEERSYSLLGQRRHVNWLEPHPPEWSSVTSAGYAGHEDDTLEGLVNMKGRMYDPLLGRFLTADPAIGSLLAPQSLNPYTYALNNPLSLVDPSGFDVDTPAEPVDIYIVGEKKPGFSEPVSFGDYTLDLSHFSWWNPSGLPPWTSGPPPRGPRNDLEELGDDLDEISGLAADFASGNTGTFCPRCTSDPTDLLHGPGSRYGDEAFLKAYNDRANKIGLKIGSMILEVAGGAEAGAARVVARAIIRGVAGEAAAAGGRGAVRAAEGALVRGVEGSVARGAESAVARGAESVAHSPKLLPSISQSTVEGVIASSGRNVGQTTAGAVAMAKKHGHAAAKGTSSAYKGIAPTQANANSIIRSTLSKPARVVVGKQTVDVYNTAGQGVRYELATDRFTGLLEETMSTR